MAMILRSSTTYDQVARAGPPVPPLGFPKPKTTPCELKMMFVKNHQTGELVELKCVVIKNDRYDRAYAIKKTIARSSFGTARICVLLRRSADDHLEDKRDQWETTDQLVVLKQSSWSKMRAHQKDPFKEAAALEYVGDYHPHILGCEFVLEDNKYLYIITRYCSGGDLYLKMQKSNGVRGSSNHSSNERQARIWFRQLIQALGHLQKKGVCHLNVSLENLLIDEHNNLQLVDFGYSYRVPYSSACNAGCISDISDGTQRRMIALKEQWGDLTYVAPEVIDRTPFDGYTCDLWSAGIVLFILLVDMAPFQWAHESDLRYRHIAHGRLKELLHALKIPLSDDACDLLQQMMWHDPRKRLTLSQVMKHPWFIGHDSASFNEK